MNAESEVWDFCRSVVCVRCCGKQSGKRRFGIPGRSCLGQPEKWAEPDNGFVTEIVRRVGETAFGERRLGGQGLRCSATYRAAGERAAVRTGCGPILLYGGATRFGYRPSAEPLLWYFYFAIFFVAGTGSFSAGRAGIRYSLSVGYVRFGYIRYICLDRTAVRPRTGLPSDGRFRFFIE